MIDFKLMVTIQKALKNAGVEVISVDQTCNHKSHGVELVNDLLSGKKGEQSFRNRFYRFCNMCEMRGLAIVEDTNDDLAMLDQILNSCDNKTLEELLFQYQNQPKLVERIETVIKKRISAENGHPNSDELTESYITLSKKKEKSFYDLIKIEIDKKYKKESDFYNEIGFPRQQFSRIRLDPSYTLRKENVYWITCGLNSDFYTTQKLLEAQGYSYNERNRTEIIIMYVVKSGKYTLEQVNDMLVAFGERPLGAARGDRF